MIPCACGCGTLIKNKDKKNRYRRFVWGHHLRLLDRSCWKRKPNDITKWNCRTLCRRKLFSKVVKECYFKHIGGCNGRIEVHHIDKNPKNNSLDNLKPFCQRHHVFIHKGYMNLNSTKNPKIYTYPNGKVISENNKQYIRKVKYENKNKLSKM
jgi:hypothetical protein